METLLLIAVGATGVLGTLLFCSVSHRLVSGGWDFWRAPECVARLAPDPGLSTLESEIAANAGEDWEEVLDQRALELDASRRLRLPRPPKETA